LTDFAVGSGGAGKDCLAISTREAEWAGALTVA